MLHARRGRVSVQVSPWALNLPRLYVGAEEGGEYLAFDWGNGNSDPVFHVELSLAGTRAGRVLGWAYWTPRDLARRLRR